MYFCAVTVCSAGVGRSGTMIAIDAMMQRLEKKNDINIYEFMYSMRCDRPYMIQNLVCVYIRTYVHPYTYIRIYTYALCIKCVGKYHTQRCAFGCYAYTSVQRYTVGHIATKCVRKQVCVICDM